MICKKCGREASTITNNLCDECYKKEKENRIESMSKSVKRSSDLAGWNGRDLSDLFWINLGRYIKEPNEECFAHIKHAFYWACHSDHGLSSSFSYALKWAKIDLYEEGKRWNNKTPV